MIRIPSQRVLCIAALLTAVCAAPGAYGAGSGLAEARKATAGSRVWALAGKSDQLLAAGDAPGLAVFLAAVRKDPALEQPAREKLLYDTLMGLADIEPDATVRDEVGDLRAFRSTTTVVSDEHGHRELHLLYDVAAAARFTERRWEEHAAHKSATSAIELGDAGLPDRYATGSETTRRGIEEAVAAVAADRLLVYSQPLLTDLEAGRPVGRLALRTARRTGDAELYGAVLELAPPRVALDALAEMRVDEWPGQALPLLAIAAGRPETASAAMLRLGPMTSSDPAARELLLESLGGPHGASAAAAVARVGSDALIDELARRLVETDSELVRRQALLGLRLTDTPRARSHLAAFAARPDAPPHLVDEVPAWLRD